MKLTELLRKSEGVDPGCSFDFPSKKVHDQVEAVAKKLAAKYGVAKNCGRNRVAFEGKKVVIKLPRNMAGILDNEREARRYQKAPEKDKLARARLAVVSDIPLIVMIKLDTLRSLEKAATLPKWADFFDCGQVGLDPKGCYRAYDYGS